MQAPYLDIARPFGHADGLAMSAAKQALQPQVDGAPLAAIPYDFLAPEHWMTLGSRARESDATRHVRVESTAVIAG